VARLSEAERAYWQQKLIPLYEEFMEAYGEEYLESALGEDDLDSLLQSRR